uniref:Adenylosuccinate synthetase n=2 Tax=Lutzomyia longipalpis TaxID=7200 RepID=A0A1B0CWS6_LUTLO
MQKMANGQVALNGIDKQARKGVTVVLGAQWGDEGKGKVVDMLATNMDIVTRCQGGNNADHAVCVNGTKYIFHLLPIGIINEKCVSVIGNGVVIHLPSLFEELKIIEAKGVKNWEKRLIVSDRAHLVFDFHQQVDELLEAEKGGKSLGTTKKGIGPTYSSKATRNGIRVGDLLGNFEHFSEKFQSCCSLYQRMFPDLNVDVKDELVRYKDFAEKLRPLVGDTVFFMHKAIKEGKKVLVEGANAAMLDIDFGTYPYEVGEILQSRGGEIGETTKRKRRCGWLDLVLLRYTAIVNGYTDLYLTKLDILDTFKEIKVAIGYKLNDKLLDHFPTSIIDLANVEVVYATFPGWETCTENVREFSQLPKNAQDYVRYIENDLEIPVKWIGVGKGRESTINVY